MTVSSATGGGARPVPNRRVTRVAILVAILAGGLGVGVATSYLQGALPDSMDFLANSGAVWTVLALALAAPAARHRASALAGGLLALLGEVAGYYLIASPLRHVATSTSERALWFTAAVVLGPVIGAAASLLRTGTGAQRVAAWAATCGVVAGEGAYAFGYLHYVAQGWIEVGAAALALALGVARLERSRSTRALALPVVVVVAVLVYAAYRLAAL